MGNNNPNRIWDTQELERESERAGESIKLVKCGLQKKRRQWQSWAASGKASRDRRVGDWGHGKGIGGSG